MARENPAVNIRLPAEEHEAILEAVEASGLNKTTWCLVMALVAAGEEHPLLASLKRAQRAGERVQSP